MKVTPSSERGRRFSQVHPLLAQALWWSIPAICAGAALRLVLLSYHPYAYWGADSWSYFGFTYKFFTALDITLNDKRRYLYPLFLMPVSALPGSPLQWLAWLQHLIGLITIVPLAYAVRRFFVSWKIVVIPLTTIWAGLPIILWYEHELLAESLFFAAIVWSIGGWAAWTRQSDPARARRLFWLFLAGFACVVLTKPAGRFIWPGVLAGLIMTGSWRVLHWRHFIATVLLLAASLTIGQDRQSAWLLYSSSFPLTRLESGAHSEYKAQISDLVMTHRRDILRYHERDGAVKKLLKRPGEHPDRPLWAALEDHREERAVLYRSLALEGIMSRPHLLALISLTRALASANLSEFNTARFDSNYFSRRFAEHDEEWRAKDEGRLLKILFALPRREPLPPYAEIARWIEPHPDAPQAKWLRRYADRFAAAATLIRPPEDKRNALPRPSPLGWWLLAGIVLSFTPPFWRSLAPWTLTALGYLAGVYLVGSANPRFFVVALPVFVLLLAVPFDLLVRTMRSARTMGSGT